MLSKRSSNDRCNERKEGLPHQNEEIIGYFTHIIPISTPLHTFIALSLCLDSFVLGDTTHFRLLSFTNQPLILPCFHAEVLLFCHYTCHWMYACLVFVTFFYLFFYIRSLARLPTHPPVSIHSHTSHAH